MLAISLLLVVGLTAHAGKRRYGRQFEAEDSSPAVRVYNGFSSDLVITTGGASGSITCVVDSTTTTITDGNWDTVADLAAQLTTISNSSSRTLAKTDTDCVAATTESTDDELMDNTAVTIKAGTWGDIVWDTSDVAHFDVYIPGGDVGGANETKLVEKILGSVGGTGNITLTGYIDGVQAWENLIVSPVYRVGATSANTTTSEQWVADDISPGELNLPVDLGVNPSENLLIRATRATTGTTGGMTAIIRYGED
jgi:hypothetical protein